MSILTDVCTMKHSTNLFCACAKQMRINSFATRCLYTVLSQVGDKNDSNNDDEVIPCISLKNFLLTELGQEKNTTVMGLPAQTLYECSLFST